MPLRPLLKRSLQATLSAVPLRAYERLFPRTVIGLCYHIVADERPEHVAHICPYKTSTQFDADLRYLAENYEVIDYDRLRQWRADDYRPRRPAVVITFDDGFRECHTVVQPLLRQYGFPAIFFITTDFIDNKQLFYRNKISLCIERAKALPDAELRTTIDPLGIDFTSEACHLKSDASQQAPIFSTWLLGLDHHDELVIDRVCTALGVDTKKFLDERHPYLTRADIDSLLADGHTIGAHGRTHTQISRLEDGTQAESEIVDSCQIVAEVTDCEQVPFAFPFGGRGVSVDQVAAIRSRHPHIGMIFDSRGLLGNGPAIVHRVSSDESDLKDCGRSNLPLLIRDAYQRQFRRNWIEPLKRSRRRASSVPAQDDS